MAVMMLHERNVEMIIRSKHICTPNRIIDGCMEVRDGKIAEIREDAVPGAEDFSDMWVIPGIFDTHNHACGGYDLHGQTEEQRERNGKAYLKSLARCGVTLVFPSLFSTVANQKSLDELQSVVRFVGQDTGGARAAGIHFEGPFLNRVGEKGRRYQAAPIDLDYVKTCLKLANGTLKLMGHAPELLHSTEMIRLLLEHGVTAAFTHSDADSKEAFRAFDDGVTVATHTCNVMTGIHHRDVGGLGAALLDDRVWCELICDGLHICNDMLRLILRVKSHDRIIMISDSSTLGGMPSGRYHLDDGVNIVDEAGRVLSENGQLEGSSKPVLYDIRNLVRNVGVSLPDALRMACLNPCVKYGFADRKGSLREGKDADFVLIDSDFQAVRTYLEGKKIYDRETDSESFNPVVMSLKEK